VTFIEFIWFASPSTLVHQMNWKRVRAFSALRLSIIIVTLSHIDLGSRGLGLKERAGWSFSSPKSQIPIRFQNKSRFYCHWRLKSVSKLHLNRVLLE